MTMRSYESTQLANRCRALPRRASPADGSDTFNHRLGIACLGVKRGFRALYPAFSSRVCKHIRLSTRRGHPTRGDPNEDALKEIRTHEGRVSDPWSRRSSIGAHKAARTHEHVMFHSQPQELA